MTLSVNQSAIVAEQEHQLRQSALIDEYETKINAVSNNAVFEIGLLLTEYKEKAGHGNWMPLLERLGIPDRRAREYMQAHETFLPYRRKTADLGTLTQTAILMLAAPSTPENVREAVIEEAKQGKRITIKELKTRLDEVKPAKPNGQPKSFLDQKPTPTPPAPPLKLVPRGPKPVLDDIEAVTMPVAFEAPALDTKVPEGKTKSAAELFGTNLNPPKPQQPLETPQWYQDVKAYLIMLGEWDSICREVKIWIANGRPNENEEDE